MEHRMKKTWIVVADEAIARLLEVDGRVLKPVEELTDPDAHAKASEMRNDAHGRRGNSITTSAGEAELHQEGQRFARQVAQRLAQVISAPPEGPATGAHDGGSGPQPEVVDAEFEEHGRQDQGAH